MCPCSLYLAVNDDFAVIVVLVVAGSSGGVSSILCNMQVIAAGDA